MLRTLPRLAILLSFAIVLAACGDGGAAPATRASSYDLQAGLVGLINSGETANVTLSGTVLVNGNSVPFTGTGTLTFAPSVSVTFNNTAALS